MIDARARRAVAKRLAEPTRVHHLERVGPEAEPLVRVEPKILQPGDPRLLGQEGVACRQVVKRNALKDAIAQQAVVARRDGKIWMFEKRAAIKERMVVGIPCPSPVLEAHRELDAPPDVADEYKRVVLQVREEYMKEGGECLAHSHGADVHRLDDDHTVALAGYPQIRRHPSGGPASHDGDGLDRGRFGHGSIQCAGRKST